MTKKSKGRKLLREQGGTSSVEIVVMLPVFIILFFAVSYCYAQAAAKQEALTAARGCAFQFAMNGCELSYSGVDLCASAEPRKLADVEGPESTGVFAKVEQIPLVGAAVETLFGEGAGAHATRSIPGFMGREDAPYKEHVYLVCNTKSRTIFGHVKDSFCDFAKAVTDADIPGC
jgi:hypothetical protein